MSQDTIHREMTIEEILSGFPQKAQRIAHEMAKAGLQCAGCNAATWETLEVGMRGHGMNESAIEDLLQKLNAIIAEKTDLTTITLTKRAAAKYLQLLEEDNKQGWGIRFTEKMSGCNGFEYELDFSEEALPDDSIFESHGIEIHINKEIVERLIGSEIDYIDGLTNSGFKVSNPNARSSCGCGSSHGY